MGNWTWAALIFGLSFIGCGYSAEQIPVGSAADYDIHASVSGVDVSIQPFVKVDESVRYFGHDVTARLLPILLVIENGSDQVIVVETAQARLGAPSGLELRSIAAKRAAVEFWRRATEGNPINSFGGDPESKSNKQLRADWMRKEFPAEAKVRPTRKTGGVLFFSKPKESGPFRLTVSLLGMVSNTTEELVFEVQVPKRN